MFCGQFDFRAEVARRGRVFLKAADELHDCAVRLIPQTYDSDQAPRGVNVYVLVLSMSLYVKSCKQLRAVKLLCEDGLAGEGESILRSMFETLVYLTFVTKPRVTLKRNGKRVPIPGGRFSRAIRAKLYYAYSWQNHLRIARKWQSTPGLKRMAKSTDVSLEQSRIDAEIGPAWAAAWKKKEATPAGLGLTLFDLADSLGLGQLYASIFTPGSVKVHAGDPLHQVDLDERIGMVHPRFSDGYEEIRLTLSYACNCQLRAMATVRKSLGWNDPALCEAAASAYRRMLAR